MDRNKHQLYMSQILAMVFKDRDLSSVMAFKGGTSLMFFHGLPRFSTDLDFNLLEPDKSELVLSKLRKILQRFGTIDDEADKFFGPVLVLNYGRGERMLKVEVSKRLYDNHYSLHNLGGVDMRVMTMPDMFAHKLCAMGERTSARDVFDCWFFLSRHSDINEHIVLQRTGLSVSEYALRCVELIGQLKPSAMMQGLGEVLDLKMKNFVRTHLLDETTTLLQMFAAFPAIASQPVLDRTRIIENHIQEVKMLKEKHIDISMVGDNHLTDLFVERKPVSLLDNAGNAIVCQIFGGKLLLT